MKRVNIKQGQVALVFKNGNFKQLLKEGKYWIGFGKKVNIYDVTEEFSPISNVDVLLKNEELIQHLIILNVLDNEIVIVYKKGVLNQVLKTGLHLFWKSEYNDFTFKKIDISSTDIIDDIDKNILTNHILSNYVKAFEIEAYEKGILIIEGKIDKVLEAGTYYFWKNASNINVEKVDLRQIQMEISGQELLTKDKIALRINFFNIYKVVDIKRALIKNKNYEKQLYVLTQLALREYIGALNLDELLENKETVTKKVLANITEKATALGVEVLGAGIKDIILTGDIKDIMNKVLIAQKQAQANVITRREETASTRSLLNTAKLMEQNKMLFKLKEMEFIENIAGKIGEVSINGNANIADQLKMIFS